MQESRFCHVTQDGQLIHLAALTEVLAAIGKGGFVWLDYSLPTKEELSLLIEPLGLHPLAVEDCIDEIKIPKIDDYPGFAFLSFNGFNYTQGTLSIIEIDMFIGADFLITVKGRGSENRDFHNDIERIVKLHFKTVRQGPAYLMHIILDHIVDQKFVAIETFEDQLDKAEDEILSDLSNFSPATILDLRRNLFAVRKSLFHEREVLVKICRKDCHFIPEKALFFYRDVYDHLSISFEMTETSRDVVNNLMEMYLSMLNNQMAQTSNRTNLVVRRLTFITTIFMPLTLLAGIGGMSEWSMMTGSENWRISYPAFLLMMIIIGIGSYHLLKLFEKKDRG
jgi:magnesium transporter